MGDSKLIYSLGHHRPPLMTEIYQTSHSGHFWRISFEKYPQHMVPPWKNFTVFFSYKFVLSQHTYGEVKTEFLSQNSQSFSVSVFCRYDTFVDDRSCIELKIAIGQKIDAVISAQMQQLICCVGHYPSTTRRTTFYYMLVWTGLYSLQWPEMFCFFVPEIILLCSFPTCVLVAACILHLLYQYITFFSANMI